MTAIIGIDLGTTNSLVSYWNGEEAIIIPNAFGDNLTPSVVGLDDNNQVLVGAVARERLITHPHKTAAIFKRYMGSDKIYDFGAEFQFTPEDLSSFVLRTLKADAEAFLGIEVFEAVISVPAYFNDQQRRATQAAGKLAGLNVERLINEPTAAALSYGLHRQGEESCFLIFDLGGGTFDVSVLSLFSGIMEVNATAGHNALGGEDFVDLMLEAFIQTHQLDDINLKDRSKLRWKIELLKRELTTKSSASFDIELNHNSLSWCLTRDEFETLAAPLINCIRQPIESALNDAAMSPTDLKEVILVGGATRMPLVRSLVAKMFGKLPTSHLNPDEIIALGAAVQAGLKARDASLVDVVLTDVCPYTLGLETIRTIREKQHQSGFYAPIIERNTVIPVSKEATFTTFQDNQSSMLLCIYQGESRLVCDNIKLGELIIDIEPAPAGEQSVTVRYTYDINGILEVDTRVNSTGKQARLVIRNNSCRLSDVEIQARFRELEALKIHPRDQLDNRMLLARGARLFEQSLGDMRHFISELLAQFEILIDEQNPKEIKQALIRINAEFAQIELKRM